MSYAKKCFGGFSQKVPVVITSCFIGAVEIRGGHISVSFHLKMSVTFHVILVIEMSHNCMGDVLKTSQKNVSKTPMFPRHLFLSPIHLFLSCLRVRVTDFRNFRIT